MEISGRIITGLGEGASYVQKYQQEFLEKLGFTPFPGTLNLKTAAETEKLFEHSIRVDSAQKGLHPVLCKEVIINNKVRAALIRPLKTSHPKDVLEILAPLNIKDYFHLQDGDEVTVRIL